jgi:hypothetical protein
MMIKLDKDIQAAMIFRVLFGTQDDHYDRDTVTDLINGLRGVDDESLGMTIAIWAINAAEEIERYRN